MNRRNFLNSILALSCAPAIVRAENIMRIRPIVLPDIEINSVEYLIDSSGRVLKGWKLYVYEPESTVIKARAVSDHAGRIDLNLTRGTYIFVIESPDGVPAISYGKYVVDSRPNHGNQQRHEYTMGVLRPSLVRL